MRRVAMGDEQAFAMVVRRHAPRVRALALRHSGRAADADDVSQEAFARVWSHAARFEPAKGAFRSWLYRIVANLCLDAARRRSRWSWIGLDESPEPEAEAAGPAETMAARQALAKARGAIAALPERQRMALLLSVSAELSSKEIAEAMGASVAASDQLISRARRALRRQAADEGWDLGA